MLNPNYTSTTHGTFVPKLGEDPKLLFQPKWVKMDRQVLRYYGYFREAVVESRVETSRIRKLIICFYLEDNSISATEEKQENSGIPQGYFLKREKCLKADESGRFLSVLDFRVGSDILIYGKNIRIYDCDEYTRQFYKYNEMEQPPREEPALDDWTKTALNKFVPVKDAMMKDYLEHKLGGGRVHSQKQFLENDRKVLKFFAESQNQYIIHYFLADDTLEIREISTPNSGRDPFPVEFKRQKLPRKFSLNQPGQTYAEDFVTDKDIRFGEDFVVFGKVYRLKGCDPFTHQYYRAKYGAEFPLLAAGEGPAEKKSNVIIPPHNGFGDEVDSLGFVFRLIPIPPKKDFFKWVDNQGCLRFTAQFNTAKPEDAERRFIINYYLSDDSIQIYEPPTRNSGFSEGKFLERGKYKHPSREGEKLGPADLVVGQDVRINGHLFHVTDCDEFTKKWYAANTEFRFR